jgi:hypothetical protein
MVSRVRELMIGVELYLDDLGVQFQPLLLVGEEFLYIFALISLKLDYFPHLAVIHDGAIASYWTTVSQRPSPRFYSY